MRKVSIIGGAGTLGAAIAFSIAFKQNIEEICLIDQNEHLLQNHIMDMKNAFPSKNIVAGKMEDLVGSTVVIITAGVMNRNDINSRNEFLAGNIKIFSDVGEKLARYAPGAIIVTASNPVDILNFYLYKNFGFSRQRLIGYTMNDSYRFEWAIRKVLSLKNEDVIYAPVIGEHGNSQVLLFSQTTHNGAQLQVSNQQKAEIYETIKNWFGQFNSLGINRTTGWTTAVGISSIVEKLFAKESFTMVGSAVLQGEYGTKDISIGVPLVVNSEGIQRIEEWNLTEQENKDFLASAQTIQSLLHDVFHTV